MKFRNEGSLDRALRIALGVGLMSFGNGWLAVIALVPLLTGLFGFCPLYQLLGIRTCAPSTP